MALLTFGDTKRERLPDAVPKRICALDDGFSSEGPGPPSALGLLMLGVC